MKVSAYIDILQILMKNHGDLEVETYNMNFSRMSAIPPSIRYRKILNKRERKPSFWCDNDESTNKGEKVIYI